MGGRSENTLRFRREFKPKGHSKSCDFRLFRTVRKGHRGHRLSRGFSTTHFFSRELFCPLCKEFLAQLPEPREDSALARPSHRRVNCEELLIRIPSECNELPLWLSLERWDRASHGSEVLFGFGTATASQTPPWPPPHQHLINSPLAWCGSPN